MNGKRTATVSMVQPVVPAPSVPPVARPGGPAPTRGRVFRLPGAPEPTVGRAAVDHRRDRAVIALLTGILTLVVLGHAATAIVRALPPRIEFVSQDTTVVQGFAVEWKVHLRVAGEEVTATFYSEREQIRLMDELIGRE